MVGKNLTFKKYWQSSDIIGVTPNISSRKTAALLLQQEQSTVLKKSITCFQGKTGNYCGQMNSDTMLKS